MGGRTGVGAAAALWIGLLAGAEGGTVAILAAAALALPLLHVAVRAPVRTGAVALALVFLLLGVARGGSARLRLDAHPLGAGTERVRAWLDAEVVEPPVRGGATPVATVRIRSADPGIRPGSRGRLRLPEGSTLEWGDRFTAYAELGRPPGLRNPGGFDARAAAAARGRVHEGRVLAITEVDSTGLHAWPRSTVARWRRGVEGILSRALSPAAQELVTPLMSGDRSVLSPEQRGAFQRSGLVHLLALSGLHVTWMAGVARFLVALAGGGPVARAVAGAACSLLYLGLVGPVPSLARAAFMECTRAAAQGLEREVDALQALSVTVLALLMMEPAWAADLGFQLSCAATLGLVTLLPWLTRRVRRARALVALIAVTVCAQVPALPLLMHSFHGVSWSAVITNVVAAPLVGVLLSAAWVGVVLEACLPGTSAMAFAACELAAAMLANVASFGAGLRHAMVPAGGGLAAGIAGCGALLLCVALGVRVPVLRVTQASGERVRAGVLGLVLFISGLVAGIGPAPLLPARDRVWLVLLDVGQGQALALGFHDGWWLIDAGVRTPHFDAGESVVLPALRSFAVTRLSALIVTHGDMDHAGGAAALQRVMRPMRTLGSGGDPVRAGDVLRAGPDTLRVLWPPGDFAGTTANDSSVVLKLEGPRSALFTADVDSLVENALPVGGPVAVLQVGHHGAASSSGSEFLRIVRPSWALISAGRRNRFGHPHEVVLERLSEVGGRVLRTDREGAVWLELSRDGVTWVDWRRGLPARVSPPAPARPTLARPQPHC